AYAGFEFLRLANWKVAWDATRDHLEVADASTIKVFGTEHYLETFRLLMEVLGERSYLVEDTPGALLAGRLEQLYRSLLILTFGGGTNELQRDLIAGFGLGMPMAKR
ncbi:MAG TPA: acyl-CoA dehydrogenase family protein, partial [Acidimicrobiales bacterium]|nr:acyl-CoA dehydrogenase family protein [Acidimicrobiales bacterium]